MTAGSKFLRKIQMGGEDVAGTGVAASTIWRGKGTLEDTREDVFPEEDVGYIGGTDRAYTHLWRVSWRWRRSRPPSSSCRTC